MVMCSKKSTSPIPPPPPGADRGNAHRNAHGNGPVFMPPRKLSRLARSLLSDTDADGHVPVVHASETQ